MDLLLRRLVTEPVEPHIHDLGALGRDLVGYDTKRGGIVVISSSVTCTSTALCVLMQKAPSAASATEDMLALMMEAMFITAPLFDGMRALLDV